MTEQQTILRGKEAQAVLDNAAFVQAFATLKSEIHAQWKACPVRDREGQVLLLQLAKMADKFEGILAGMVQSGNFAAHRLELQKAMDGLRDEAPARRFFRKVMG